MKNIATMKKNSGDEAADNDNEKSRRLFIARHSSRRADYRRSRGRVLIADRFGASRQKRERGKGEASPARLVAGGRY